MTPEQLKKRIKSLSNRIQRVETDCGPSYDRRRQQELASLRATRATAAARIRAIREEVLRRTALSTTILTEMDTNRDGGAALIADLQSQLHIAKQLLSLLEKQKQASELEKKLQQTGVIRADIPTNS